MPDRCSLSGAGAGAGRLGAESSLILGVQTMSYVELGKGAAPPAAAVVVQAQPVPSAPPAGAVAMVPQPGYGQVAQAVPVHVAGVQPGYGQAVPAHALPVAGAQPGYGLQSLNVVPVAGVGAGGRIAALAQFGDLFIQQRVEMVEMLTGFETENQYDIFGMCGGHSQQVLYAAEQSECCGRQCCGSSRAFRMLLFGLGDTSRPLLTIERPLRCKPPLCCGCLQEVTVFDGGPGGAPIGKLQQLYTCCASEFTVCVGHTLCYRILGPICVCDGPFCDQVFYIVDPAGQRIATPDGGHARITKMAGHFLDEAMTDADNFGCTFPLHATPEQKAVLLAAVFLIDFLFFEDGGAASNGGLGDD